MALSTISGVGAGSSGTILTTGTPQSGGVIQVVNATYGTYVSATTNTYADTGLTASISPKFSTSKILVLVSQRVFKNQTSSAGANILLLRNATTLVTDVRVSLNDTSSVGNDQVWSICYLDSPATTSSTTYKTQFNNNAGSGTVYVNLDGNLATITLMEIAA